MTREAAATFLAKSMAGAEAQHAKFTAVMPAHLLIALCKICDMPIEKVALKAGAAGRQLLPEMERDIEELRSLFRKAKLDTTAFRRQLRGALGQGGAWQGVGEPANSPEIQVIFVRSEELARVAMGGVVRPVHLLCALTEIRNPPWSSILKTQGVESSVLADLAREAAIKNPIPEKNPEQAPPPAEMQGPGPAAAFPRGARPDTPLLDKFGRDLTLAASEGRLPLVIGRTKEMKALVQVLMQKRKCNAILVGDAGVGKTGVVEGLAQRIVKPDASPELQGLRIVEITMSGLVAGTTLRGQFEERLQGVIREAASDKKLIVFIDEIHTMMGAGGDNSADAANILKPALARGEIRCIGATTIAEYRRYIEKDSALERRFQMIWVDEPTREEAIQILQGLRPTLQEHHGLTITDEAIDAAVTLSMRYLPDLKLPDKAIDLIDQAAAKARMFTFSAKPGGQKGSQISIARDEIAAVVAQRCRVPIERLTGDEAQRLLKMEEIVSKRVIGQDEAVRQVCEAIRTARAGLKDPRKPIGVFLFLGTTGTGKTELAKALAEFLFDDERRIIRCDMSEYMDKYSVAKLIGAPPGYIGYDQEGQLTGQIRTNPYSVVLFDEIEKAHPEVLDIFLQIFDEGCLTDSHGKRASFTETVIILTSNLGAKREGPQEKDKLADWKISFRGSAGGKGCQDPQAYRERIMAAVGQKLRPELVNRISRCVFFYPLSLQAVRGIIDKALANLQKRLADRKIGVKLSDAAYELLMAEGYDEDFGAREMERAVERLVVQPLGMELLGGRFAEGDVLIADVNGGKITFRR